MLLKIGPFIRVSLAALILAEMSRKVRLNPPRMIPTGLQPRSLSWPQCRPPVKPQHLLEAAVFSTFCEDLR
jgi:hypothetical protein